MSWITAEVLNDIVQQLRRIADAEERCNELLAAEAEERRRERETAAKWQQAGWLSKRVYIVNAVKEDER